MNSKIKIEKATSELYLYYFIIYLLIIQIESFQFYKAFILLSNDILLFTDEGIIKNSLSNLSTTTILSYIKATQDNLKYISFTKFTEGEGGYIICRLKNTIFVFNNNLDYKYGNFEINESENFYWDIKSYKADGKIIIIFTYINLEQKMRFLKYQINLNQENNFVELIHHNTL